MTEDERQAAIDAAHAAYHEPFQCPYADARVAECRGYQRAVRAAGAPTGGDAA